MNELRQSVAEDLAYLVETFRTAQPARHSRGLSDDGQGVRAAVRSGGGTCDHPQAPRGETVCNPSDPEATLDGHKKGSGYQVQLSETCGAPTSEVQLIVSAIAETALPGQFHAALAVVIEDLKTASGFGSLPSCWRTRRMAAMRITHAVSPRGLISSRRPQEVPDPPGGFGTTDGGGLHGRTRRQDRPLGA